jgi:hypothetical protein
MVEMTRHLHTYYIKTRWFALKHTTEHIKRTLVFIFWISRWELIV